MWEARLATHTESQIFILAEIRLTPFIDWMSVGVKSRPSSVFLFVSSRRFRCFRPLPCCVNLLRGRLGVGRVFFLGPGAVPRRTRKAFPARIWWSRLGDEPTSCPPFGTGQRNTRHPREPLSVRRDPGQERYLQYPTSQQLPRPPRAPLLDRDIGRSTQGQCVSVHVCTYVRV